VKLNLALCPGLILLAATAAAAPRVIVLGNEPHGRTPAIIGYNLGDDLPGSNVGQWLAYSGANGVRFWWKCFPLRRDDAGAGGTEVRALEDLRRARATLRADPLDGGAIDWSYFDAQVAAAYGGVVEGMAGDCYALSAVCEAGLRPLVMIDQKFERLRMFGADGSPDWRQRWQLWRNIYAQAFYLSRYYDVSDYEYINEPDHVSSARMTEADYLARLEVASDAVQCAVQDVDRRFGKALSASLGEPVVTGINVFHARSGRPDRRDAQVGWGELVMGARAQPWPLQSAEGERLFHDYNFHNYGRDPAPIYRLLPVLAAEIAAANGGRLLPIDVTEFNVSTARAFSSTPATLDSPGYYPAFGAISTAYINLGTHALYIFKMTQTAYFTAGSVKKNGMHLVDLLGRRQNILAATRGAEVARLVIRGFAGARDLLSPPPAASFDDSLSLAAAHDRASGDYTVLLSNTDPETGRQVELDLTAWPLPLGTGYLVQEVSAGVSGGVVAQGRLDSAGRKIRLSLPPASVELLTVESAGAPGAATTDEPLEVAPGDGANRPGWLSSLGDQIVFEGAGLRPLAPGARVLLSFRARSDGADAADRIHIFGMPVRAGAPSARLHPEPAAPDAIWESAMLLGQFAGATTQSVVQIDVTDYIRSARGGRVRFVLTPDPRPRSVPAGVTLVSVDGTAPARLTVIP